MAVTGDDAESTVPDASCPGTRQRRLILIGVVGAVVASISVALVWLLSFAPFVPVDESANVDYAIQVTHGRLPIAATRIVPEFAGQRQALQHVSNHPPLYHAIVGPILRFGLNRHHPEAAVVAARLVTLGFAGVLAVLMAVLAWSLIGPERARSAGPLSGRRSRLVVAAAGLVGLLPSLLTASAIVQNDSLAAVFVVATLIFMVRIVRFGTNGRRVAGMSAAAAGAALTRITSYPVIGLVVVTVTLAGLLWSPTTTGRLRRLVSTIRPAAITAAVTACVAGWFVVLNIHRYHDWTGGRAVDPILSRRHEPAATDPISYLLHPGSWSVQVFQLTGGLDSAASRQPATAKHLSELLIALLLAGLVAAVVRVLRRSFRLDRRQVLCVGALAIAFALSMGEIVEHALDGGGPHGRYLLPAAGAIGIAAAGLLLCLPRGLDVLAVGVVLTIEAYGTAYNYFLRYDLHHRYHVLAWFTAVKRGMGDVGVPAPNRVLPLILGLAAAGILLQLVILSLLGSAGHHPVERSLVASNTNPEGSRRSRSS